MSFNFRIVDEKHFTDDQECINIDQQKNPALKGRIFIPQIIPEYICPNFSSLFFSFND